MMTVLLTKIMGFVTLLAERYPTCALSDDDRWKSDWKDISFMKDFLVACDQIAYPFMLVCCMVGCIYAIVLGVNMAKSDGNNVAEAKKKIVAAVSSMIGIVVLVLVFKFLVIPNLTNIVDLINDIANLK